MSFSEFSESSKDENIDEFFSVNADLMDMIPHAMSNLKSAKDAVSKLLKKPEKPEEEHHVYTFKKKGDTYTMQAKVFKGTNLAHVKIDKKGTPAGEDVYVWTDHLDTDLKDLRAQKSS